MVYSCVSVSKDCLKSRIIISVLHLQMLEIFYYSFGVHCNTNNYFWKGGKEKFSFCERLFPGVSVHKVLKICLRLYRAEGNNCSIDSQKA